MPSWATRSLRSCATCCCLNLPRSKNLCSGKAGPDAGLSAWTWPIGSRGAGIFAALGDELAADPNGAEEMRGVNAEATSPELGEETCCVTFALVTIAGAGCCFAPNSGDLRAACCVGVIFGNFVTGAFSIEDLGDAADVLAATCGMPRTME